MNKLEITVGETSNREREVYRTLRTNIEFTGVENRVIAVTSCAPNDGKSTVSYQLANAFAETGKKTLLIDADLRKSVLLNRLDIQENVKGLSHVLSGQASINDVICATNQPNFYIIPAGVFPTNPTELLGNDRFEKLISAVRDVFKYVIVDTPPIGSVIDAAVVAKQCDGTILVLSADSAPRGVAKSVVDQIRSSNENILGVVLNKVNTKSTGYYGHYGHYGYYGGSYGKYDEDKK